MSSLDRYREKRDFSQTPEPTGAEASTADGDGLRFVIQKHAARRLHYDLRLELDGVLLSWAVPKGPSLDPAHKRLAVRTENHPLSYASFEGIIPRPQYGAGTMIVWDRGRWWPDPAKRAVDMLEHGRLHFFMDGEKVRGKWHLIRTRDTDQWLLIKDDDEAASDARPVLVDARPQSVLSGRTIEELRASDKVAQVAEKVAEDDTGFDLAGLAALEGATLADPLPDTLAPQLAKFFGEPPRGDDWLHEIKLDGYRLLAFVDGDRVVLRTRNGKDLTSKLPGLVECLRAPRWTRTVLDGELCAVEENTGRTSFERLQAALSGDGDRRRASYHVFDAPFALGHDLRGVGLEARKRVLRSLLERDLSGARRVHYCKHVRGAGEAFFEHAAQLGLEGVVSKYVDARYVQGRVDTWRKIKVPRAGRYLVGGLSPSSAAHRPFASLLVGERDETGALIYRGKVGSGLSDDDLDRVAARAMPLRADRSPFVDGPAGREARDVVWLDPVIGVTVRFGELTNGGKLRHPRVASLHLDDEAPLRTEETRPEASRDAASPGGGGGVRLTHPGRLIDAAPPFSKRDFAGYVMALSEWMLPHLADRPLTLIRGLEGVSGPQFFQRHRMEGAPAVLRPVLVPESPDASVASTHATIDDPLGLVALVQIGALEFHVWTSRRQTLEQPDRLVFDLDPDPALPFAQVMAAAREVRERLEALDLVSFVKTTGGKGLHVVAPLRPELPFDVVKAAARKVAEQMVSDAPGAYTLLPARARRRGKIYLDVLRNARGATHVAAYSPRASPGLPVATPLDWEELDEAMRPDRFSVHDVVERLAGLDRDPWAELERLDQRLPVAFVERLRG